jgi:hypothetical protein
MIRATSSTKPCSKTTPITMPWPLASLPLWRKPPFQGGVEAAEPRPLIGGDRRRGRFTYEPVDRDYLIAPMRVGLSPAAKVLDLKGPRVREEGASGRVDRLAGSRRVGGAGGVLARPGRITGERPSIPGKERRRVGGNSRHRSPRGLWPRAGPVPPSPP